MDPETEKRYYGRGVEGHQGCGEIIRANGSLDFIDQAVAGGREHAIRHLEVAVPFISTIPSLAVEDINPRLSAVVNGASFNLGGRVKPFGKSQESVLHIVLQQLQLPEFMAYAPQCPPVDWPVPVQDKTARSRVELNALAQ